MAHKTLISGTAYDITGGKTLVSGTSYSVKNGKVLIGGTAYDISFKKQYPPNVQDFWTQTSSADVVGPAPITGIVYANGIGLYADIPNKAKAVINTMPISHTLKVWTARGRPKSYGVQMAFMPIWQS